MELLKLSEEEFDRFARVSEQATFLQTSNWGNIKKDTGWESEFLGFKENKKIIAGMLLLSKKTPIGKKMFYAPRGPILDYENLDLLHEFMDKSKKYIKKNDGIFFKIDPYVMKIERDINGDIVDGGIDHSSIVNELKKMGFREQAIKKGEQTLQMKWLFRIDLRNKTIDDVMKDMTSKTRQMIRKNEKNGVVIREGNYDDIIEFKKIMDHTGDRRNFLRRSLNYYQNLYKGFGNGDKLKLYFADLDIENSINEFNDELKNLERDFHILMREVDSGKRTIAPNKKQAKEDEINKLRDKINEYQAMLDQYGNKVTLGGIFYFGYGNEVISFIGGAYDKFMDFQSFYTLHYEMIKYAIDNNYDYYNFYGICSDFSPKDPTYGIYLFKKGFGGNVLELLGEFDLPINRFYYFLYHFSFHLSLKLKRLKARVSGK